MRRLAALPLAALAAIAGIADAQRPAPLAIFDAHLHYNVEARSPYPLERVLALFREHGVRTILATSRPNDGTRALVDAAARAPSSAPRVVPFIRPYRDHADRGTWFRDPSIYALIEQELARGLDWRGIGEFHVFGAADAGTPEVGRIIEGEGLYRRDPD